MPIKICLKELAEARRLNISQVQRQSGLTITMVRRYWYNKSSSVDLRALAMLTELLQVEPGDLLKREKDEVSR